MILTPRTFTTKFLPAQFFNVNVFRAILSIQRFFNVTEYREVIVETICSLRILASHARVFRGPRF